MLAWQRQDGKEEKKKKQGGQGMGMCQCVYECVCVTESQRRGVHCYVKVGSQLDNG